MRSKRWGRARAWDCVQYSSMQAAAATPATVLHWEKRVATQLEALCVQTAAAGRQGAAAPPTNSPTTSLPHTPSPHHPQILGSFHGSLRAVFLFYVQLESSFTHHWPPHLTFAQVRAECATAQLCATAWDVLQSGMSAAVWNVPLRILGVQRGALLLGRNCMKRVTSTPYFHPASLPCLCFACRFRVGAISHGRPARCLYSPTPLL